MSPRDYVAYLLTVDAEIEHSLMVQYLYAGWSLGGPQVPPEHREQVAGWQKLVLGIAKEEMGHLISVQNVLRLIGAPLFLGRQDFPWDSPFIPCPFALTPATLDTLALYVYAESPPLEDWRGPFQDEILERLKGAEAHPNRVGALFTELISCVEDPDFLPDRVFQARTRPFQADFSEWGRGNDGSQVPPPGAGRRPDLLIEPLTCRDDAVAALQAIASQGEATLKESRSADEGPSHFTRFKEVYLGVARALAEGWCPYREVAVNPTVSAGDAPASSEGGTPITHPTTELWAHLFNVRYRLLLQTLLHSFEVAGGSQAAGTRNPRGLIIHTTFGEMYNLRALADILMRSPLNKDGSGLAGPPFLIPYTFDLPQSEGDRWRRHVDLLDASARLVKQLAPRADAQGRAWLESLTDADRLLMQSVQPILSACSP